LNNSFIYIYFPYLFIVRTNEYYIRKIKKLLLLRGTDTLTNYPRASVVVIKYEVVSV
jgi:hypothetical protein